MIEHYEKLQTTQSLATRMRNRHSGLSVIHAAGAASIVHLQLTDHTRCTFHSIEHSGRKQSKKREGLFQVSGMRPRLLLRTGNTTGDYERSGNRQRIRCHRSHYAHSSRTKNDLRPDENTGSIAVNKNIKFKFNEIHLSQSPLSK